jgi:hypothetical protein
LQAKKQQQNRGLFVTLAYMAASMLHSAAVCIMGSEHT